MIDPKRLKDYPPDRLLVAVLIVVLSCAGLAFDASAQKQQTPSDPGYYTVNCDRPKDHEAADLCEQRRQAQAAEDSVWWTRVGFFAVVASLFFTGWAAFAAMRAAKAADKSVNITSQTSQTELRAYLFVKNLVASFERLPPNALHPLGHIHKISVWAEIENSGSTPARNLVVCLNSGFFDNAIPPGFDYSDTNEPRKMVVGPRAVVNSEPITLHVVDMDRVTSGKQRCFCWGWIDYNDVFHGSPRHRTEFCFEVVANQGAPGELRLAFPTYGPFNGADSDCLRQPQPPQSA
jgi:hypothetical protein